MNFEIILIDIIGYHNSLQQWLAFDCLSQSAIGLSLDKLNLKQGGKLNQSSFDLANEIEIEIMGKIIQIPEYYCYECSKTK